MSDDLSRTDTTWLPVTGPPQPAMGSDVGAWLAESFGIDPGTVNSITVHARCGDIAVVEATLVQFAEVPHYVTKRWHLVLDKEAG